MAIFRNPKCKQQKLRYVLLLAISVVAIGLVWVLLSSSISVSRFSFLLANSGENGESSRLERKYLYWGNRIDCPGKHLDSCEGLGHQESSLRCALEEALYPKEYL